MAEVRYALRGGAVKLFQSRSPFVIASGPAGTGKSVAGLLKLHTTSLQTRDCMSLLLRQTHASLTASTLVTFEQKVAKQELTSGEVKWFGGSGRKPPAYEYANGSRIIVGGLDQPGKFLSMDVNRIVVDEANQVSVTAIETLMTRLRGGADTYRQIMCMTNPDHPDHHLKKRADAGEAEIIYSLHRDNPFLFHRDGTPTEVGRDYMARLDSLTGVRLKRYRHGIWAASEGLVYDDWSEASNVVDPFPVPKEWPLVISVDFGFSHPMVIQWWRVDPDGRMYLTREISKSGVLVEDHARHVKEIMAGHPDEPRPVAVVCDHDLEDRKTLERHLGLATLPAKKAVTRGVQLMQSRIRPADDGKRRLFVFRGSLIGEDKVRTDRGMARGLPGEMLSYVWAVERGSDGIPKEAPVKDQDDSADCARYAVAYLDWNEPSKAGNPAAPAGAVSESMAGRLSRPVGR